MLIILNQYLILSCSDPDKITSPVIDKGSRWIHVDWTEIHNHINVGLYVLYVMDVSAGSCVANVAFEISGDVLVSIWENLLLKT